MTPICSANATWDVLQSAQWCEERLLGLALDGSARGLQVSELHFLVQMEHSQPVALQRCTQAVTKQDAPVFMSSVNKKIVPL
eukprot:668264-Pelagomonas_calceolata.AAC.4